MTTTELTTAEGVTTITMDDGKANVLSPTMLTGLRDGFDRAREDDDVRAVVLAGRPGRFSGGFDLGVLGDGGPDAVGMLRGGFELAEQILSFPKPVVVACTGHAIAMGAFLLCSGDHRVGAAGDFDLRANEVAIGLTLPYPALAILRHRLSAPAFDRAAVLSEASTPTEAVERGWLDQVVDPDEVIPTAQHVAESFADLDPSAHANTKRRARAELLTELRRGIESEFSG